jgi:DNA-binding Lrp family transcriptional regulator
MLPRSARITAVTAHSLLHMYVGGADALGFLEVLPAERVEPLRPRVRGGHLELGELDVALFQALGADGRTPYADVAAATGWSESTVRRRMDQLREAGALYYDIELDMAAFGFLATTWLWMSVPLAQLSAVGTALAKLPEVAYAVATTGAANLAVCTVCRDESEFYEFMTGKVGALPGVERVETSPVIRTVKQASPTVLPGH